MGRMWLLSLAGLSLVALLLAPMTRAGGGIKVDEHATQLFLAKDHTRLSLVVENTSAESEDTSVRIEVLTPNDDVRAVNEAAQRLNSGRQKFFIDLPLAISKLSYQDKRELLWYRVRYRITSNHLPPVIGVISLSEITPDLFELFVASSEYVKAGSKYRATVRAVHPLTGRPSASVSVSGRVKFDTGQTDQPSILKASDVTDESGFATLDFDLPRKIESDEIDVSISGVRNGLEAKAENNVDVFNEPFFLITTDKGIYQPGQVLHARLLLLDSMKRARANETITLKITDPEDHEEFTKDLVTSNFGIASADWTIPESARLGDYRVEFKTENDQSQARTIKISRYELPNFTVDIKPDKPYYLPNQNASVEIRANYLFGEAVKTGHVRVVHETSGSWNSVAQRYEIDEAEKYEGDVDAKGVVRLQIDLSKYHDDLQQLSYSRFQDLSYAAYFTDPSTNRTEQRRFDLRVTKEAIHLYVKTIDSYLERSGRLPLRFYVAASYADGTAARCSLSVKEVTKEKKRVISRVVRTNRYGLAKVEIVEAGNAGNLLSLALTARDRGGKTGTHSEEFDVRDEEAVRVETRKTLYAPGEDIEANITSTTKDATVLLQLSQNWAAIRSQIVRLRDGQARVVIPYEPRFKGVLTLSATANFASEEATHASQTILYPEDQELKVELKSTRESYQPGEDAQLNFRVRGPNDEAKETALGVVVLDKAIEERMRTDLEFGARGYDYYDGARELLGYDQAVAGITRRDLNRLDLTRPVPRDFELVAEVLMNQGAEYYPSSFGGEGYERNQQSLFDQVLHRELQPLAGALKARYDGTYDFPTNLGLLNAGLSKSKLDFNSLRDPWGVPFQASFHPENDTEVLAVSTSGPDKVFGTADDFVVRRFTWRYFLANGDAIDKAVADYHRATADFILDRQTLDRELKHRGVDLNSLRDPWGHPYKVTFNIYHSDYVIKISSAGPNGRFESDGQPGDDVQIWRAAIDYFAEQRDQIDHSIHSRVTKQFPENEAQLREALSASGIDLSNLRDPWDNHYYTEFSRRSFTSQRTTVQSQGKFGQTPTDKVVTTATRGSVIIVNLRSKGPDGLKGNSDDFTAGSFSTFIAAPVAATPTASAQSQKISSSGSTAAIGGRVTDSMGALIPGVNVWASNISTGQAVVSETDENGQFLVNLPAGVYSVRFEAPGFKPAVIENVVTRSATLVELSVTLEPGASLETVTVTAEATETQKLNNLTSASVSEVKKTVPMSPGLIRQQLSTPRVREYFPETLVWQPQLETDKQGRAQLKFKLADNITTWKVSVISSTAEGEIGIADTEIKAFQPFFVEHDPPKVLTEGDQISLPVVLRNYLDRPQVVNLELKPESWFELTGPARHSLKVPAAGAVREIFDLRAIASVKDGKQRVTAAGSEASDAIEKPLTVHPDGEEIFERTGGLIGDSSTLEVNVPESAIERSVHTNLKIYPNLMAHVTESVEGILVRPHGCGEQTISSTYPSLLVLKHQQKSAFVERARKYLDIGYNRLLTYRHSSGGFMYWADGEPDVALTAYALKFLTGARGLIEIEDDVGKQAAAWLLKQQLPDGGWPSRQVGPAKHSDRFLTAYVARVLAKTTRPNAELGKAFNLIAKQASESNEPYLIASFALASFEAGDSAAAVPAIAKLRALARKHGSSTYWELASRTPFYGWGLAGRVETTALAIQALARAREMNAANPADDELILSGLRFLLEEKDRYGVWYSTQATVNVLDTMLTLLVTGKPAGGPDAMEVLVNGDPMTVPLVQPDEANSPRMIDISNAVRRGRNQIEIRRSSGSYASAQVVTSYYVPWQPAPLEPKTELLKLAIAFDKQEVGVNDPVKCHVEIKRPGNYSNGMMLAEIGLPPGADVSRESLQKVMKTSSYVNQYDVLPDRIIFYVWPWGDDTVEFDFEFRPRFGLKAKSAASSAYDYYNPEAKAVVAPTTFVVR
jgi:hypothetical protein